ncbi:MAG: DegT/DnrJ/EryC1/StrS family aminotransferase [Actinomycetia bacterium]|nr:DegT/DnrJ/EryC1/StrS family aminotransferase [Actinomycetes bacterium]
MKKLASEGARPLIDRALPAWPQIPEEGIEAVAAVLRSGRINYWTGAETRLFEAEFSAAHEGASALAVSSGTLALELALRSFGVGAGDEVIVPSRTFIATAGAVVAVGATPVIADIDPTTGALTPLSVARRLSPRTRAVIVVHVGGYPAPVAGIRALCEQLDVVVIEDCAQAQGARAGGRPVGLAGHAACFSFCQDKILPLGEGGMIVYPSGSAAFEVAAAWRDHGHRLSVDTQVQERRSQFRYLSDSFGTNARMTEAQGALGRVLLAKVPAWHKLRTRNARVLTEGLSGFAPVLRPCVPADDTGEHAFYRHYFLLDSAALAAGWDRDRVIDAISAEGAPVQFGACALIGREKAFATLGVTPTPESELPGALCAAEQSLAFFVHPTLSEDDLGEIAQAARKVLEAAIA